MFVRIQTDPTPAGPLTAARALTATGRSGYTALYALRGPAGDCVVTLWRTRSDAELAHAGAVPREQCSDLVYEVIAEGVGDDVGRTPRTAAVLWFDGPIHDGRREVLGRTFGQRIPIATAATPGIVRCIVGWHAGTRALVEVLLAMSADAIDAAGAAVNAPLPVDATAIDGTAAPRGPDTLEPYGVVAHRCGSDAE